MPQPQHMVVLSPNNKLKPFRSPCTHMRICLSIVLVEVKSSDETSVGGKRYAVNSSMVYLNDPSLSCHTHVVQLEKCVVSTCREGWFLRTSRDVSSQNASIVSKVTTPSMLRLTPRTQFLAVFKARTCKSRPNRFSRRNQNLQIAGPMRISKSFLGAISVHQICQCTLTTEKPMIDTA